MRLPGVGAPTALFWPLASSRPSACSALWAVIPIVPELPPAAAALPPPVTSIAPVRTVEPMIATGAPLPPLKLPADGASRPPALMFPSIRTSPPLEVMLTGAADCSRVGSYCGVELVP